MKYIKYEQIIDATDYINHLSKLKHELPLGAYTFASDKNHYDFTGDYNVHDLSIEKIVMTDKAGQIDGDIYFIKNKFKHTKDLIIEYKNITNFSVEKTNENFIHKDKFGEVIIDEILPAKNVITHEILLTNSKIKISCEDLFAKWI